MTSPDRDQQSEQEELEQQEQSTRQQERSSLNREQQIADETRITTPVIINK